MAFGAGWTMFIRFVSRSIGLLSTLILARLLSPDDFGVYALAMSMYALIELLRAFGFGTALIQRPNVTVEHYDTAWTFHLIFSLFSTALLFFSAPSLARLLGEPDLEKPLEFLSLLFLCDGVKNIGVIDFQKNLTFDREFRLSISVKVIGFLVTIPLAIILRSYWAMMYGLLATTVSHTVLTYLMHPHRPGLTLRKWRDLLAFSSWLQVNNIINYLNKHVEKFLVTRELGVSAVGSLAIARESGLFIREFLQPVNRAVFPGYSKANHSPKLVGELYLDVLSLLFLIAIPTGLGLSSVADVFVPVVLGEQWLQVVPLVSWFAVASAFMVAMGATNSVIVAMGRPRAATVVISFRLAVFIGCLLFWLPQQGLIAVAYAYAVSLLSASALTIGYVCGSLKLLPVSSLLRALGRPLLAGLIMFVTLGLPGDRLFHDDAFAWLLIELLIKAATGALLYSVVLLLLWIIQGRPAGPELRVLKILHARAPWFAVLLPRGQAGV